MKPKLRLILKYFLAGFTFFPGGWQHSFAQLRNLSPVIINETNGLSGNAITYFFQDHNGYMWIGTISGLNRYDGYSNNDSLFCERVRIDHQRTGCSARIINSYYLRIRSSAIVVGLH